MDPEVLDSLTPAERSVLQALLRERDRKLVARELGLSPETVKTHLRNAREKCGHSSSFALAKAVDQHSASNPERVIPPQRVVRRPADASTQPPPVRHAGGSGGQTEVRESRIAFDFGEFGGTVQVPKGAGPDRRGLQRLLLSALLILLLMAAIILAFPLSESFQRLANVIQPPSR